MKGFKVMTFIAFTTLTLCAQDQFNDLVKVYNQNAQKDKPAALEAIEKAAALPELSDVNKCEAALMKLKLLYGMPGKAKECTETADALLAMPQATPDQKFSAYYLGGIKYGELNRNDKYVAYENEAGKNATNDAQKFAAFEFRIRAYQKVGELEKARKIGEEAITYAKDKKLRSNELAIHYAAAWAYPKDERENYLINAISEEDSFNYLHGQLIARYLISDFYHHQPEKAKALCLRVLKAPKIFFPDFQKKVDEMSK